jgi:uncharacterized membrane protein
VTDKSDYDRETSKGRIRFFISAIFLVTVAMIATAIYVSFTPLKSLTINGVQYRYLIPLIFPLLFVVGSSRLKNIFNKNIYNTAIFAVMACVMLQGIWELVIKFYY